MIEGKQVGQPELREISKMSDFKACQNPSGSRAKTNQKFTHQIYIEKNGNWNRENICWRFEQAVRGIMERFFFTSFFFGQWSVSEAKPIEAIHEKLEIARRFLYIPSWICDIPQRYYTSKRYISKCIRCRVLVF